MQCHSTESTPAVAYSYIRFSTRDQAKGDSLRRQTEAASTWCEHHNVLLDTSTTFRDLGKSAYLGEHRKNPDRYALAAFLKLAEGGHVPHGSYLIVENLDRLTREHVRAAVTLFLSILELGVNIVTTTPERLFRHDSQDMTDVIIAVVELSRGHGESKRKSDLLGSAWREKKKCAREGKPQPIRKDDRVNGMSLLTHRLPAWVEERGGRLRLIPAAADTVRKMFRLAASGYGIPNIIKKLVRDGDEPLGRTGRWSRHYVWTILRGRRALGEYQPRDRDEKPQGDPIPTYYPAVVSEDQWKQAQRGIEQRRRHAGRVSEDQVNIFSGLLKHSRDGDSYVMATRLARTPGKETRKVSLLVNNKGVNGNLVRQYSLPYGVFEAALLTCLREIDPHEILNGDHLPEKTTTLAGELVEIESELADAAAFMEVNGFSPTIGKRIADLETRKRKVAERLAEARTEAAHPLSESWGECQSLVDTLAAAPDPRDARLRLRAVLRRIVVGMLVLIVPRKLDRLAAVQFDFPGGKRRSYLLLYRPGASVRPGFWCVRSWTDEELRKAKMPVQFDLRHANPTLLGEDDKGHTAWVAGWQDVERDLLALSAEDLDQLVFGGCEKHELP
jgi:DNA invertase Pin-like site-specific DNA recombinase